MFLCFSDTFHSKHVFTHFIGPYFDYAVLSSQQSSLQSLGLYSPSSLLLFAVDVVERFKVCDFI